MSKHGRTLREENRGASETAGAALLIGLAAMAALTTLVIGGAAMSEIQTTSDGQQASTTLQEMDSRFSSLTASAESPEMTFDLGDTNPDNFRVRQGGFINISVNRNSACTANMPMSSMVHANNQQEAFGYEAGGVWYQDAGNGSSMITSPSVTYDSGTIDIDIVNLTGTADESQTRAQYMVAKSKSQSTRYSNKVFSPGCVRPDNVTLQVRSQFYVAWGNYLENEFSNGDVETFESNTTAKVFLEQSDLPARVDDSRNNVVNLTAMEGPPPAPYSDVDPPDITVDKGAGNVYSVSVTPLNTDQNIGNITNVENATNVTRPPLDVMFVIDESGSMENNYDGDSTNRITEAKNAAQGFLGDLNASKDRAGLTTFESGGSVEDAGHYYITDNGEGQYITSDFDSLNATIDTIDAGGGTESQYGIEKANNVFELRSNETRKRVMILLTDGMNDDCQDAGDDTSNDDPFDCGGPNSDNRLSVERAEEAAANGVTIYTIGYGDPVDIDQALLREVADRTGGTYYQATSASKLADVLNEIRQEIAQTKQIGLTPVSATYSSGGTSYGPQAAGSMSDIAQVTVGGNQVANINDPTTASRYSYSFAVPDGEPVDIEAFDSTCSGWEGTGRTLSHNGTTFDVIRCTNATQTGTLEPNKIFLDGEIITNTTGVNLLDEDEAWWQDDINATLIDHPDIGVNTTGGSNFGRIGLKSNQALVYWDLEDGVNSENRLLMLYEIGIAESDAETAGVINIEYSTINLNS